MILADTVRRCAYLSSLQLEVLIRKNYPEDIVQFANFIGITNGGQFCYDITFPDADAKNGLGRGKVFVEVDQFGELKADY